MIGTQRQQEIEYWQGEREQRREAMQMVCPVEFVQPRFLTGIEGSGGQYRHYVVDTETNQEQRFEYGDFVGMNAWKFEQERRS